MANYDFKDALVLVTGGASGIGRSCCQAFAKSNATVIVADINTSGADETLSSLEGNNHMCAFVDVSSDQSIKELSESIKTKYGRSPSKIVHSAGIVISYRKSILDIPSNDWSRIMDVNLKGTFLINQTFGRLMIEEKIHDGSIVNIASMAAVRPIPIHADYCASKAGVVCFTKNFAHEMAQHGIRVNAVSPGSIQTPLLNSASPAQIEDVARFTPMGRIGQPDEVARVCLFLASNESSYITGESVAVSGGF